jgi:hypothetical protein
MLDELYRIAFRKKLYETIEDLQTDLDLWMREFNEVGPPQGKWCFGKTPLQTFLDALPLAKEDGFGPNLFQDMNAGSVFSFKAQRTRERKRTSARDAGWPSQPRLQ